MMLRLQKYGLTITYKKKSEMYLGDTLSKVFRQPPKEQDRRGDAEKYFVVVIFWCCIGGLYNVFMHFNIDKAEWKQGNEAQIEDIIERSLIKRSNQKRG